MFYIIPWSIKKEKNNRILNNIESSRAQICDLILTRLGWWIYGWGDPIPFSMNDIIRNPTCLKWCENGAPMSFKPARSLLWTPPSSNGLKWNVDASYNPTANKSAIGGVLRNSKGEFMCIFSTPILPMEINNVLARIINVLASTCFG